MLCILQYAEICNVYLMRLVLQPNNLRLSAVVFARSHYLEKFNKIFPVGEQVRLHSTNAHVRKK